MSKSIAAAFGPDHCGGGPLSLRGGGGLVIPPPAESAATAGTGTGVTVAFWVFPYSAAVGKGTSAMAAGGGEANGTEGNGTRHLALAGGVTASGAVAAAESILFFRGSDAGEPGPMLSLSPAGVLLATVATEEGREQLVGPTLRADCWTHVALAVTYAAPGLEMKLFLDGSEKATLSAAAPAVSRWAPVYAGCGFGGAHEGVAAALGHTRVEAADVAIYGLRVGAGAAWRAVAQGGRWRATHRTRGP